jgi:CheY-like chemotaxis protein
MVHGRPHILVLDGAQEILELFRDLLEEEGYRVSLSLTAEAGVDLVKDLMPDLVVLDLVLGRGDSGRELLWQLRQDPVTARVLILVCTGAIRLLDQDQERLAEENVAIIQKPFDIDELLAAIAGCLALRAERPASFSLNGGPSTALWAVR